MNCPNCNEPEECIEIGTQWCHQCNIESLRYVCDECLKEFLACGHDPPEKHACDCNASKLRQGRF